MERRIRRVNVRAGRISSGVKMKDGNGVSMKSALQMEMEEITRVLEKYGLDDPDKETVISSFKEISYQWCLSNAHSCALEVYLSEKYPEVYEDVLKNSFFDKTYNAERMKKILDTYPWVEKDDDEDS